MEPFDLAYERLCAFVGEALPAHWKTIKNEADTRFKIIDKLFVQVLGWPEEDIHLEEAAGEGRSDYRLTVGPLNRMIVEAKREGRDLGILEDHAARAFKLNGGSFKTEAAQEGIGQVIHYCGYRACELGCVTNGRQWMIFRGNRGADGIDTLEGKAVVFGSLEAVKDKFQQFYDLLSYEAVGEFRYRAVFQEAEGQPIRSKAFRAPVRTRESRVFLKAPKISQDIDRIMLRFFQNLTAEDDAEARRDCFVTTTESRSAEEGIARISEELRDQVQELAKVEGAELVEAIKRVKDMHRHELILLVGTKGSGKSTFMERFFADVLSPKVAEDCVVVRIDLANCGCDATTINKWLDENFLLVAERAVFADKPATYDELVGMYWWEYQSWRDGHAKHLYETDKNQFKIDFGRHIAQRREDRPHEHIIHLLTRAVKGLKKVPCLVFDNADHFDVPFQEEVFKYAHALYRRTLSLVLVPITDTTSWQLARQGPMQSFYTESYFLPTPPTELVLRKRIEYLEKRIKEQGGEKGGTYFMDRGIPLAINDIKGFAACLQTVFINTGEVADWIGRLANQDIRRCLQLTREVVASPHINIQQLLTAFFSKSALEVDPDEVKMAMVRGRYDIYPAANNSFVQNIFSFVPELDTTPLIAVRILRFLETVWEGQTASSTRYAPKDSVLHYMQSMNVEPRAAKTCLQTMLETGLCLSYDPTVKKIDDVSQLQISPSGKQHLTWAQRDWVYLESMAEVTPLLDADAVTSIRANMQRGTADGRRMAISVFINYLLAEDGHYCLVPKHEFYASQSAVRNSLKQQVALLNTKTGILSSSRRFARKLGRVVAWKPDKAYGFIRCHDGSADAFVHINDVLSTAGGLLPQGADVEFDVVEQGERKKAVNVVVLDQDS